MVKNSKYKAFTLIEMLIVMSILVILSAITASAFSGLRSTILLNENVRTLQQDVIRVQRAATLLSRSKEERWLYGIGIDFRTLGTENTYRFFKWCSPYTEYGDPRTTYIFPNSSAIAGNFNVAGSAQTPNAAFPAPPTYPYMESDPYTLQKACNGNLLPGEGQSIGFLFDYDKPLADSGRVGYQDSINDSVAPTATVYIEAPLLVGFAQADAEYRPAYVLYESVSGRVFMYNAEGQLLNFDSSGNLLSNPQDFEFAVVRPDKRNGTMIRIAFTSGKTTIRNIGPLEIGALYFPPVSSGGETDGNEEVPPGTGSGTDGNEEVPPGTGGSTGGDAQETGGTGGDVIEPGGGTDESDAGKEK